MEAHGLATLTIGSVAEHLTKVAPPRGLQCHFPLGRPLGKPNDPQFQHEVLKALFSLLDAPGPRLDTFPETIDATASEALVCTLPPRMNEGLHPAVDEAQAIRAAYDRAVNKHGNRIGAAREISADQVPAAIGAFVKIADGTAWQEAGIPGNPMRVAQDIRGYYQTAATELAIGSYGAWAGETWFYEQTETGRLILEVRRLLKAAGAPHGLWFYLSPGDQPA